MITMAVTAGVPVKLESMTFVLVAVNVTELVTQALVQTMQAHVQHTSGSAEVFPEFGCVEQTQSEVVGGHAKS